VARFLAPKASEYIREGLEAKRLSGQELSPAQLEAFDLDDIWGTWEDEGDDEIPSRKLQAEENEEVRWEQRDIPAIQQDPPKLKAGPECSRAIAGRAVPSILLQAPLQQGYVTVITESAMWEHHGAQDVHSFQGLTSYTILEHTWTIMSGLWNHLLARSPHVGKKLALHVREEVVKQESLEEKGYRSPSWRVLKALQAVHGACVSVGETAVGAAPMFLKAPEEGKRHSGEKVRVRWLSYGTVWMKRQKKTFWLTSVSWKTGSSGKRHQGHRQSGKRKVF
jgi:hypothetical protein